MFKFRRRETPWEVVDSKVVEPVPICYEYEDLDIAVIGDTDIRGTYVFEVDHQRINLQNAVIFARRQLLQEIIKKGHNILLVESWQLTTYRRGKQYRVEVKYGGRPARALGKLPETRPPPFVAVLQASY